MTRDVEDRVSHTADRLGTEWVGMTYLYGAFGQLEDAVDPAGNVFHTMYDKLGRRILLDDPDRGITTWSHNPFGEIESELDALGDTTLFGRDVLGRVTSTAHDVHGITSGSTYHRRGQARRDRPSTGAASPDGVTTAYEYDDLGRNTRTVWNLGTAEYDLVRTYDEYSRLKTIRYPLVPGRDPFVVRYGYNDPGFTRRVYDATNPAAPKILWEIGSRNEDGLPQQTSTGNGFTETRQTTRRPAGSTTSRPSAAARPSTPSTTSAIYGNIRHRDDYAQAAPRAEEFEYDDLDRLWSWKVEASGEHRQTKYGYDVLGNLETISRDGAVETQEHTGAMSGSKLLRPHALTTRTLGGQATSYTYDDRGRQRPAPAAL